MRIDKENDSILLKGELKTVTEGFDETALVDETRELDESYEFTDNATIEDFFSYLFGIPLLTDIPVNKIRLDENGNLFAKEVHFSKPTFDSSEQVDTTRQLDTTHKINTEEGAEKFFEYLFGITSIFATPTEVEIHGNKILVKEVLESQIF